MSRTAVLFGLTSVMVGASACGWGEYEAGELVVDSCGYDLADFDGGRAQRRYVAIDKTVVVPDERCKVGSSDRDLHIEMLFDAEADKPITVKAKMLISIPADVTSYQLCAGYADADAQADSLAGIVPPLDDPATPTQYCPADGETVFGLPDADTDNPSCQPRIAGAAELKWPGMTPMTAWIVEKERDAQGEIVAWDTMLYCGSAEEWADQPYAFPFIDPMATATFVAEG